MLCLFCNTLLGCMCRDTDVVDVCITSQVKLQKMWSSGDENLSGRRVWGPTDLTHIELPYIVSESLQTNLDLGLDHEIKMELECLGSILTQLCLNVRFSEEEKSLTHPVISNPHVLCQLPFWTEVTRAPVESQAASKPKSLLLLGFWFRLMRISQWFSCEPNRSNSTCAVETQRERESSLTKGKKLFMDLLLLFIYLQHCLWTTMFKIHFCSLVFLRFCLVSFVSCLCQVFHVFRLCASWFISLSSLMFNVPCFEFMPSGSCPFTFTCSFIFCSLSLLLFSFLSCFFLFVIWIFLFEFTDISVSFPSLVKIQDLNVKISVSLLHHGQDFCI